MMARYTLRIEALSPLALTSGKADVTLDSAISGQTAEQETCANGRQR